jgi:hypothetical protein
MPRKEDFVVPCIKVDHLVKSRQSWFLYTTKAMNDKKNFACLIACKYLDFFLRPPKGLSLTRSCQASFATRPFLPMNHGNGKEAAATHADITLDEAEAIPYSPSPQRPRVS